MHIVQKVSSQSTYMLGMEEETFLKEDEYGNKGFEGVGQTTMNYPYKVLIKCYVHPLVHSRDIINAT